MFFKHKHLLEELRQNGRRATAEILSTTTMGSGGSVRSVWSSDQDLSTGWMDCRMKLRVVPKNRGELPFEATVLTRIHTLKLQGGQVPVWYDPEDHSKVVVDYEADLQAKIHYQAESDRLAHRYDTRLGMAWTPVGGVLLPVEATLKPGKGRLTTTGQLGKLVNGQAESALSYVRAHADVLLPRVDAAWFARYDICFEEPYGDVPPGVDAEEAATAGAALAVALVSLLAGRVVRSDVAVTGSLTSTGALEPVSSLGERAYAAKETYATHLVAPAGNEKDVREMPQRRRQSVEFVFVPTLDEAFHAVLGKHPIKGFSLPA